MVLAFPAERSFCARSTDGVVLYVRRWLASTPCAGTVVLVHGAAEHGGRYPFLVRALTCAGYHVAAPDLRGHGKSGGQRGNVDRFERLLDDIDTVLDELAARDCNAPIWLIGYSMGGLIASEFALHRPARVLGLVVAAPAFGTGGGVSSPALLVARILERFAADVGLVRMNPGAMSSEPAVAAAYLADPDVYHGRLRAGLVGAAMARMRDLPARIAHLSVPLLVLHGDCDQHASPSASRRVLAAAASADKTLIIYPAARHDLFNEPSAINARVTGDIIGWLNRLVRSSR